MHYLKAFSVVPELPEKLQPLKEIGYNYWWGWNADAFNLFRHAHPELWTQTHHNPVQLLNQISQQRINELAADEGYLYHLERVVKKQQEYMTRKTWFGNQNSEGADQYNIAYFSAEFGLNEGLPIYSGGLGVLAGDHLKSSSDLGLPLVGVGLAYRQGYFRQYLNRDGFQQERYVENDFYNMPLRLLRNSENAPVKIELTFPGRVLKAQIWKVQVGRIQLFLLDSNLSENSPTDRDITSQLYGGDQEMRIQQEILLGMGGIQALDRLGIHPAVTHMNEGHSAFLGIQRVLNYMEKDGLNFVQARELVSATTLFTTHTPVPAGIDRFPQNLIEKYLRFYFEKFGMDLREFMNLGRYSPNDEAEPFSMAILALRFSSFANGVARLHGHVSRKMFGSLWPKLPLAEVPIDHVTNGVHVSSWISMEMSELFDRYLGPRWVDEPGNHKIWLRTADIPSAELWGTHERRRERLVGYVRRKLKDQLKHRGAPAEEVDLADQVLDPETLTIGFARRFATYKRATLIFRDIERLIRLVTNKNMPVQFIFAGKAHPHDEPGKQLIQEVVRYARRPELRRRIVFLEDYDLNCAHYLLQGADVWLNNPRRPLEASGTSGMKAIFNGGLNLSVLDGWWDEGYNGENGWAIGNGEEYADREAQDRVESAALYEILENEVVPLFYNRGADDIPEKWIRRMKQSMASLGPVFNTNRMVAEYFEKFYRPQLKKFARMTDGKFQNLKHLCEWKKKVQLAWDKIRIVTIETDMDREFTIGNKIPVKARVDLGQLSAGDVRLELYYGLIDNQLNLSSPHVELLAAENPQQSGVVNFAGFIPCEQAGNHGFTLRLLPMHQDLLQPFEMNLIHWADELK